MAGPSDWDSPLLGALSFVCTRTPENPNRTGCAFSFATIAGMTHYPIAYLVVDTRVVY